MTNHLNTLSLAAAMTLTASLALANGTGQEAPQSFGQGSEPAAQTANEGIGASAGSSSTGEQAPTTARPEGDQGPAKDASAACRQDVDGSGGVGFGDLLAVLDGWGACQLPGGRPEHRPIQEFCPADINGDGTVGFEDLIAVLTYYESACGAIQPTQR